MNAEQIYFSPKKTIISKTVKTNYVYKFLKSVAWEDFVIMFARLSHRRICWMLKSNSFKDHEWKRI